jgi:hypothetical protein
LIFDRHNRDLFLKDIIPCFVTDKKGNLMIDRISFNSLNGRMYNHRIVIRNGTRKDNLFLSASIIRPKYANFYKMPD